MWQQLKQLAKHSAIYGLGNVANTVLSFLLVPFYTHQLTPAAFGIYSLLITVFSVLSLLVDAGFTNSISRYYFNELPDSTPEVLAAYRRRLISTALISGLLISAAISLTCYLCASAVTQQLFTGEKTTPEHIYFIQLVAITVFFRGLTVAPMAYLRVTEKPLLYSILNAAQLALFLVLNIVLLTYFHMGVSGLLWGLLLSTALYAVALIVAIRRDLQPCLDTHIAAELLRFGLPFLPVLLMTWVLNVSDRYVMVRFLTLDDIGIYSLGYKFGQAMMLIVTAFTMGWVPIRFKILSMGEPQIIYGRVATFYVALAGLAWLTLSIYASEIVHLTATPRYYEAARFIAPVAFAYLIYGLFVLAVTGLGVAKNVTAIPFISVVAACINIGLNLWLLPRVGAIAAAYTTVVAYSVLALGSLYFAQKVYPIAYEYKRMGFLLVGMVALAMLSGLLDRSALPVWSTALLKIGVLAIYVVLITASGMLRRHEWAKVLSRSYRFAPGPMRSRLRSLAEALAPAPVNTIATNEIQNEVPGT